MGFEGWSPSKIKVWFQGSGEVVRGFEKLKKPKWNGVLKVPPERNLASGEAVRGLVKINQNGMAIQKCSQKGIQLPGRRFAGLKNSKQTKMERRSKSVAKKKSSFRGGDSGVRKIEKSKMERRSKVLPVRNSAASEEAARGLEKT